MKVYDIVIIGGWPGRNGCGGSCKEAGIERILILERDRELGGF